MHQALIPRTKIDIPTHSPALSDEPHFPATDQLIRLLEVLLIREISTEGHSVDGVKSHLFIVEGSPIALALRMDFCFAAFGIVRGDEGVDAW